MLYSYILLRGREGRRGEDMKSLTVNRSYSYPIEVIHSVITGYLSGLPQREISSLVGVPRTTLKEWISKYRAGSIAYDGPSDHAHHWVIKAPNGPESSGICKICFTGGVFFNSNVDGLGFGGSNIGNGCKKKDPQECGER